MSRLMFAFALAAPLAVATLGWSGEARAECMVDTDCTTHGGACGTDVCSWLVVPFACEAATADPGWCFKDTDCKCQDAGATCNTGNNHCTATLPDGGAGVAASGSSSSSASSSAASTSAPEAGTVGSVSSSSTSASAPSGGGGSSSSGGCSVGFRGTGTPGLLGLALGSLLVARRKRRV
jgi:hypothetical protein